MYNYYERISRDYKLLTQRLIDRGIRISTMESATSGLISSLITDTEGASAIFRGSYVTYSNETKIKCGVPVDVITEKGVYSLETAEAMASTCRREFLANIGIGITGTTGNIDPENEDGVPGQIFFAIDYDGQVNSYVRQLVPRGTRFEYKMAVADEIVQELLRLIE